MKLISSVVREILGLFVDDGSLALQLLGLVAFVAVAMEVTRLAPLWGAGLLLLGCVAILSLSLHRMLQR